MADAPPPGPPPPKVPEGWKAVWNAQYSEWFFVNTFTKASQWDKPTEPAVDPKHSSDSAPPPAYMPSSTQNAAANEKLNPNNPYNQRNSQEVDADARLAARLQAEENARSPGARPLSSSGTRGAADSYYNSAQASGPNTYGRPAGNYPSSPSNPPTYAPPGTSQTQGQDGQRGFLGKLLGKTSRPQQPYTQQGYGQQYSQGPYPPHNQYPPQGQYYGQQGYPPQQQGYYGGPPPQQYVQQQAPQKSGGIGMGGALLGAGAGLVGGALLMDAFEDHEQFEEQQAYQQGEDQGYDQGYDQGMDGGGMDGGGDF